MSNSITDDVTNNNSWKIFHRRFLIQTPQVALYNPNYIKTFGMTTSGDKKEDLAAMNAMTTVYLTINDVVELRRLGYPVGVMGEFDVMYEIIVGHIHDWLDILALPMHSHYPPPLQDIQDLEYLAMELHPFVTNKKLAQLHGQPRQKRAGAYLSIGTTKANASLGTVVAYSPMMSEFVNAVEKKYGRIEFDT